MQVLSKYKVKIRLSCYLILVFLVCMAELILQRSVNIPDFLGILSSLFNTNIPLIMGHTLVLSWPDMVSHYVSSPSWSVNIDLVWLNISSMSWLQFSAHN